MDGSEQIAITLASVSFPLFGIDSAYNGDKKADAKNICWQAEWEFNIEALNESKDIVQSHLLLTLNDTVTNEAIAQLKTISTFHVQRPSSFSIRCMLLRLIYNITCAHAQGGWRVKNTNASIRVQIPQPYDKIMDTFPEVQKKVYEYWDY
jgi:hypothetical protein